jgi:hypothetical protein
MVESINSKLAKYEQINRTWSEGTENRNETKTATGVLSLLASDLRLKRKG